MQRRYGVQKAVLEAINCLEQYVFMEELEEQATEVDTLEP